MSLGIEEIVRLFSYHTRFLVAQERATEEDAEDALSTAVLECLARPRQLSRARLSTLAKWRLHDARKHWGNRVVPLPKDLDHYYALAPNPEDIVAARDRRDHPRKRVIPTARHLPTPPRGLQHQ